MANLRHHGPRTRVWRLGVCGSCRRAGRHSLAIRSIIIERLCQYPRAAPALCTFLEKPCFSLLRGDPRAQICDGVDQNRASLEKPCVSLLRGEPFDDFVRLEASFLENCDFAAAAVRVWVEIGLFLRREDQFSRPSRTSFFDECFTNFAPIFLSTPFA